MSAWCARSALFRGDQGREKAKTLLGAAARLGAVGDDCQTRVGSATPIASKVSSRSPIWGWRIFFAPVVWKRTSWTDDNYLELFASGRESRRIPKVSGRRGFAPPRFAAPQPYSRHRGRPVDEEVPRERMEKGKVNGVYRSKRVVE